MPDYFSEHSGPEVDAAVNAANNPDTVPVSGSPALITSGAVAAALDGLEVLTPGDGIEIEDGVVSLPQAFFDYLEEATYEKPEIAAFSVTGLGGAAEIGTSVTVSAISHRETNIGNIDGNLTLTMSNTPILSGIAPSDSAAAVSFVEQTVTRDSAGSVSFQLLGLDTRGGLVSATAGKTFYVPKFIGSSEDASVTAADILDFTRGQSQPTSITLVDTSYIYFVTNGTISSVKDASTGFGVPIEAAVTQTVGINGVDVSYRVYRTSNRISAGSYNFTIS